MNRAGFLKRVFGAGIVAMIPQTVVKQIENLPIVQEQESKPINPITESEHTSAEVKGNYCFLYDNDELIGFSDHPSIEIRREPIKFINPFSAWKEYIPGNLESKLYLKNFQFLNNKNYTDPDKLLNYIIKKDEMVITGLGIIASISISNKVEPGIFITGTHDIVIENIGQITFE